MNRKAYFKQLGNELIDRLRVRFDIKKGKVIDFVVQYESNITDKWVAIVRFDCMHGFFHKDIMTPDGKQEKKKIDINDLNIAFTYAIEHLTEKWQFYKEEYLKNLKS